MYMRRYLNYAAEWQAYSNESMGHYCRRFRDAMLPYIRQELDDLEWQAMHIIRDGLPSPGFSRRTYPSHPTAGDSATGAEANANNNEVDLADFLAVPEHPPIIIIANDDDEEDVEEEFKEEWEEFEGMEEEIDDVEDDSEEILFGDDDWDVFSDVTIE
ncbi:hypothetical protein TIFTF001_034152 [Ficus carica]|uniref:Uncharacterized protein n=1 Tax=Ficus carica TaxID=3494 RepID=A0AA88J4S3_FICCA|nr:hypothetical protein TIFTF001_034152 [Ficus carica]